MRVCDICGNPIVSAVCPYCDGINYIQNKYRTVNLEKNQPTVEEAISSLKNCIHKGIAESTICIRLIHGYGSSGKGGKIRSDVRSELSRMRQIGLVKLIVQGEIFEDVQQLKSLYDLPWKNISGNNPGETFVVI